MRYFNQTVNWASFFLQANDPRHQVYFFYNGQVIQQSLSGLEKLIQFDKQATGNISQSETHLESEIKKAKANLNSVEYSKVLFQSDDQKKMYLNQALDDLVVIYEYPWQLGLKMWYIPRLYLASIFTKNSDWQKFLIQTLSQIAKAAKSKNITFIKFELDFEDKKHQEQGQQILGCWQEIETLEKTEVNLTLQKSDKKLQYLETLILDLQEPKLPVGVEKLPEIPDYLPQTEQNDLDKKNLEPSSTTSDQIAYFWQQNEKFWPKLMDKRTRYGTRKAIDFGWRTDFAKTEANFAIFYALASQTAQRQGFAIHPRSYLQTLFSQDFTRLIILLDPQGTPQAAWLGIYLNNTLTNLYGGNSLVSRDHYGQYFLHLSAVFLAKLEKNQKKNQAFKSEVKTERQAQNLAKANSENSKSELSQDLCFYDLGGLESGKGFDLFKKGYFGQTHQFVGPYDLVLEKWSYRVVNLALKIKKFLKK